MSMNSRVRVVLSALIACAVATSALADVPDAPRRVRKDRINSEQVRITWIDASDDEDGFEILRRENGEVAFESRGTVVADTTEFVDEAPRGTVWSYYVVAFNEDGDSGLSNQCYVNRTPPAVPLQFNARLIALYTVRVSWSDRSNGEDGFLIQRAPLGKRFKTIARVPANTEEYDDETLMPAQSYTYRMRALGRDAICWDDSAFTVERSVTTRGDVRVLQVELRGRGKGTVKSIPAGISCGPKDDHCTAEFPIGSDVTLVAKPNDLSTFRGWTDIFKCEGSTEPCTFNMGVDRVIGAVFRKRN